MQQYSLLEELKARRKESQTDWQRLDGLTETELEQRIAEDADENGLQPDWTQAVGANKFARGERASRRINSPLPQATIMKADDSAAEASSP